MRLLICAGGTGGGVYPALAVLQALNDRVDQVLWVGAEGGIEADMVKRENIAFETIPAAGIHGVGLKSLPGNILAIDQRVFCFTQESSNPSSLMFCFSLVDMLLFRWHWQEFTVQSLLYVPDIEPGLALKTIARFSDQIALTTPESKTYFNG